MNLLSKRQDAGGASLSPITREVKRMKARRLGVVASVAMAAATAVAQVATMPPHVTTFTGNTRGYYFTSPVAMTMTGIQVLLPPGNSNQFMNFAVVHFTGNVPPPAFPATTNSFTQLALGFDAPQGAMAPINVAVNAGDVIGVYGNTTAGQGTSPGTNSYGNGSLGTMIDGNLVTLNRSGMQFHLGAGTSPGGMHDIWSEPASTNITRIEFEYVVVPEPATIAAFAIGGLVLLGLRRRKA